MVIVTQNQYLQCSKIHHMMMDEQTNYHEVTLENQDRRTVREKYYQITIIYSPIDINSTGGNGFGNSQSSQDQRECSVIIRGAVNAHKVFRDIVEQIREQLPDQVYLDKALERMLAGLNEEEIKVKDSYYGDTMFDSEESKEGMVSNGSKSRPKKIRRTGKTKGRGKGILRKVK